MASPTEVTRDIVVAMLQGNTTNLDLRNPKGAAETVAQIFGIVHDKVKEKYQED